MWYREEVVQSDNANGCNRVAVQVATKHYSIVQPFTQAYNKGGL